MPVVTIRFRLPREQAAYESARLGGDALAVLDAIDNHLRSLLKHGKPTCEQEALAEKIRQMIPSELLVR